MNARPRRPSPRRASSIAILVAAALTLPVPAAARARGIVVNGCDGCHGGPGSGSPELTLSAEPAAFNPGDTVTLTLTLRSPSIQVGGAFITTGGLGALQALPGEGLAENGQYLTHTTPKPAVGGAVTFRFGWRAPSQPGGVDFGVAALAGNGNNASSGDSPGSANFSWAFGCAAQSFYVDLDRDGYGSKELGTRLGCSGDPAPEGYGAMPGDCNENDEQVHPSATEVCNKKDDDCNGQVDENAPPVMMWPDADGDGYYQARAGEPKLGCGNVAGYAPNGGDCDDAAPERHPGAPEACNNLDDDCDGEIDELVRPQCGVGWCSRYSPTCDPAACHPGPPALETCNHFDDDCDGEDDNGACPAGMSCSGAECTGKGTEPLPPDSPSSAGSASVAGAPANGAKPSASGCSYRSIPGATGGASALAALVASLGAHCLRRARAHRASGRARHRTRHPVILS